MAYTTYTKQSILDDLDDLMNSTITMSNPTGTLGTVGSSGNYLTSGSNGITTWGIGRSNINDSSILSVPAGSNTLQVTGDANFDGDVKIKGVSLAQTLDKINERLAILKPNPDLETRWDRLRELREEYAALEKECLEKEEIIKILEK
jgi:hypothetical protein